MARVDPHKELLDTLRDMGKMYREFAQKDIDRVHDLSCSLSRLQDLQEMALLDLKEAKRILEGEI